MRVVHFIQGKANKDRANGVNQVIAGMAKYLARAGASVRVIGHTHSLRHQGEVIHRDGFQVEAYSGYGSTYREAVDQAIAWADVVHLHGVYSPLNIWIAFRCRRARKPYVVTVHDGLSPARAEHKGGLRKRIFHALLQNRCLAGAAAIHALTEEEATDILACTSPCMLEVIPNGVDLDDFPPTPLIDRPTGIPILVGYLGRISKEKNLMALCDALGLLSSRFEVKLLLAGPETEHLHEILGRGDGCEIEWVGPKFGTDKYDFIRNVDVFVQPSLTDVFSIAAMEVLALGTPLIISRTAQCTYFAASGAFEICEPTSFGISRGLARFIEGGGRKSERAARGRQLIDDTLNWEEAARRLFRLYTRLGGAKAMRSGLD